MTKYTVRFSYFVKAAAIYCILLSFSISLKGALPNIIIILADDLGYGDPSCYNDQSKISTVHIDQLAKKGIRFTDAHSPSSVCSPTRYGLLTGRYAWRTQLKKSVLWPWDPPLIEEGMLTLPKMLQEKGYHTACVGKWHLGWEWQDKAGKIIQTGIPIGSGNQQIRYEIGKSVDFSKPTFNGPISRGFDYYFGDDVPNFPPYTFIENDRATIIPTTEKPEGMFGHKGPAIGGWDLSTVMPTITQKAVQYIDQQSADSENPFFLYLPLTAPHTPIAPSPHFIGKSEAGWYGDYVLEVDWVVGQIMEAVRRNEIEENTLIIFTSDNGSPQRSGKNMNGATGSVKQFGHDPSFPWRGMKSDIWEGGHRVPFIAKWPNQIPQSQASNTPLILVDLMRTIANIVDYPLPKKVAQDSYDMWSAFHNSKKAQPIRDHLIHHSGQGVFAIRKDNWKLILGKSSGGFTRYTPSENAPDGQLYNLATDPQEQNNLYTRLPQKVIELSDHLKKVQSQ